MSVRYLYLAWQSRGARKLITLLSSSWLALTTDMFRNCALLQRGELFRSSQFSLFARLHFMGRRWLYVVSAVHMISIVPESKKLRPG